MMRNPISLFLFFNKLKKNEQIILVINQIILVDLGETNEYIKNYFLLKKMYYPGIYL